MALPFLPDLAALPASRPVPIDVLPYRDAAGRVDVALLAATAVMRAQLETETGDKLDLAIALRVMAPALAAFSAAIAAQEIGS